MKNLRGELTTGRKSLAEVKIKREIFHRDTLTPLLFLRVIMSLNHTARKCAGRYKLHKSQEKNQQPNIHGRYPTVCKK